MRLQAQKTLEGNRLIRLGPIAISSLLLVLSFIEDAGTMASAPLMKEFGLIMLALSISITFAGVVVPLLAISWIAAARRVDLDDRESPYVIRAADWVLRFIGFLLAVICPMAIFYFFERFFPFSVFPFSTFAAGLLWLVGGYLLVKRSGSSSRLTLLAIGLILTLTVKFVDWNSYKPLVRDLFRVRIGMVRPEFNAVMKRHHPLRWLPSANDAEVDIVGNGTVVYRT